MESVLQMARLLSQAEEKEEMRRKRRRENNERQEKSALSGRTAGDTNAGDHREGRERHLREALWVALVPVSKELAETAETDAATAKQVEVAWDPKLHIPRLVRQKATRMLLEAFAQVEAFLKLLSDESTVKQLLRRLDAKGRREQLTQLLLREVDLVELKRDGDLLQRMVKQAKEEEEKLYEGAKSKQVYRNLLSATVSKLKVAPKQVSALASPPQEDADADEDGGGDGDVQQEKDPSASSASSSEKKKKRNNKSATFACAAAEEQEMEEKEKIQTQTQTQTQTQADIHDIIEENGEEPISNFKEEEEEDSEIEVEMSSRRHSLHESKLRSQALDKSLVEMRCRHNHKVALQLRKKMQKDRNVFRKLNRYLQVNEDLKEAAKWVEKIRYNSELRRCGLVSSDEEEEEEEEEEEREFIEEKVMDERESVYNGDELKSLSKEIEKDVRDFIRQSLEKYIKRGSLSPADYRQIEERATKKIVSKHSKCKNSSFLKKKGTDIRRLLDKYLLAFSNKSNRPKTNSVE